MAKRRKTKDLPKGVSCVTVNGTSYWYAYVEGEKQSMGKGRKGRDAAIAARKKWEVRKYEEKEKRAGLRVKRSAFTTVGKMIDWYMCRPAVQKQKSWYRKKVACSHLLKYFGNMSIYSVQSDDIDLYRQRRIEVDQAAPTTVDLEVSALRAAFNAALKARKIHRDMLPLDYGEYSESAPRPLIPDDHTEKLLVTANKNDPNFADFLVCGYESAMRSKEICNLRAYQVHLDELVSEVPQRTADFIDLGIFDTKTGARRTVPVSPRLKEVLQRRLQGLEPEDYVFTKADGKPFTPANISDRFKYACKGSDLPHGDNLVNEKGEKIGYVFHCLRHTRTTKWVEMGFSDEIIRRATGHRSLEAYQRYARPGLDSIMQLVGSNQQKRIKTDNSGDEHQETNMVSTG